jgi:acyl carrier protein
MLSLEEAFDIELPDRLLRRRTFSSIKSIADALAEVGVKEEQA